MEPITDREELITLNGEIKQLRQTIERYGEALLRLEDTKINDQEERITKIERWWSEWQGVYKLVSLLALALGIFSTLAVLFSKYK